MDHRGAVADRWRDAITRLRSKANVHKGMRAVHKPLLTLMLIARAEQGGNSRLRYVDLEEKLAELLKQFGPRRKSNHPEYPFWHLQTSPFWKVEKAARFPLRRMGNSPGKTTLRQGDAAGVVPTTLWTVLADDHRLRGELVHRLLDDFWPATQHEDILAAVGITSSVGVAAPRADGRKRDPKFREVVLRAYERRCAVCGYDATMTKGPFGLEAAHIRFHCEDGPDILENGLCLCSLHHKALDSGAIGLTDDHRVLISADLAGGDVVESLLLRFSGAELRGPQRGKLPPAKPFVRWHEKQVFKGPPRAFV